MKDINEINRIMQTIPEAWRTRWCEASLCACVGCVQIGNRAEIFKRAFGREFFGDLEHIDARQFPKELIDELRITKEEWLLWKSGTPAAGEQDGG